MLCSDVENKMKFRNVDKKTLVLVICAVIVMGFSLSFLQLCDFGADPFTCMNVAISDRLGWSFGNWQAVLNCLMFALVVLFAREQLGWGTLANMFLVGYSRDFFCWVNSCWMEQFGLENLFDSMAVRVGVMIPALIVFVAAASVYMAAQLGTAPYDAIAFLLSKCMKKIPFRVIRISCDLIVCLIGVLFGAKLGVVTVLMAFMLGPVITWMKVHVIDHFFQPVQREE